MKAQTDKNNPLTAVTTLTLYSTSVVTQHRVVSWLSGYHKLLLEEVLLAPALLVHVGQHVQTLQLLEQPRVGVVGAELQLALPGGGPVAGVTEMIPCIKSR